MVLFNDEDDETTLKKMQGAGGLSKAEVEKAEAKLAEKAEKAEVKAAEKVEAKVAEKTEKTAVKAAEKVETKPVEKKAENKEVAKAETEASEVKKVADTKATPKAEEKKPATTPDPTDSEDGLPTLEKVLSNPKMDTAELEEGLEESGPVTLDEVLAKHDVTATDMENMAHAGTVGLDDIDALVKSSHHNKYDIMSDELDDMDKKLRAMADELDFSNLDGMEFPEPRPIDKELPEIEPVADTVYIPQGSLTDEQYDEIMRRLAKIAQMENDIAAMRELLEENLAVDFRAMYENLMEKNNIEAIKTYRNVQAVIVEENAKQNKALFGIDGKSDSLKRRLNNVIIFSIISFVVSILVMLIQILPALGVDINIF